MGNIRGYGYPVMVIAHSSAGVQNKDRDWARWFNEQGIATASCKNRGVTVKYDEKATADLKTAVREKLKQLGFI